MIQLWINNSPYQSAFSLEDSAHLIIINTLPKKKKNSIRIKLAHYPNHTKPTVLMIQKFLAKA